MSPARRPGEITGRRARVSTTKYQKATKAQKAAIATRAATRAARTNRERHWIPAFAAKHAQETGVLLSDWHVRRNAEYKKAKAIIETSGKRSKKPGGPLDRALQTMGLREPAFRGTVGTSPDRGEPRPKTSADYRAGRDVAKNRRGLSKRRNSP